MKARTALLAGLLLMVLADRSTALQAVGRVTSVSGRATATGEDGNERGLSLRSNIFLNDTIATESDSRVQICFKDNTTISQGESGRLKIDKYVYNPAKRDENSFLGTIIKGAFRIVTGKITELNPEKFKVKTRMATVGIRGCSLGILSTASFVRIFTLELSDGSTITIDLVGGGSQTLDQPGYFMTITSNGKTTSGLISAAAMEYIIGQTTPGDLIFQGDAWTWLQTLWPIPDPTHGGKSGGEGQGGVLSFIPWWARGPYIPPDDGGGTDYPVYHDKIYTALGAGTDWTGREWSRLVDELVNGKVETRTERGFSFEPNPGRVWTGVSTWFFSPTTFNAYDNCYAYVTHNGEIRPRLDGWFNLYVTLDAGSGTWSGDFQMNNTGTGDDLNFGVNWGTPAPVSGSGQLTFGPGGPDYFTLDIGGGGPSLGPADLTGSRFEGQLVGDPISTAPNGVVWQCELRSGETTVISGGGGDFGGAS